jgi:SAM-dependent methyltransferase
MRRATLDLLRCPTCLAGSLVPEAEVPAPAVVFGPVKCLGCGARFPVSEGLLDFSPPQTVRPAMQQAMELPWVARSWERYLRPAADAVLTRAAMDQESEATALRSLVGAPRGPVIDLGCGTGVQLRRLARDLRDVPLVGVDLSRPMLDEAMAQVREHAMAADFVRARVPPLPFVDHSVGVVLAAGLLHFMPGLDALLSEIARVLKPRGRLVASTYEASLGLKALHHGLGLHPRGEDELRSACERAGLIRFERLKVGPVLVFATELP